MTSPSEPRPVDTYFTVRKGPDLFMVQYNEQWISSHRSQEEAEAFAKLKNEQSA
jgi:hypothetical protein